MRFSLTIVALALALAGCDDSVCTRNSDCKSPLVCGPVNTCVDPPDMTMIDDAGVDMSTSQDLSANADLLNDDLATTADAAEVD